MKKQRLKTKTKTIKVNNSETKQNKKLEKLKFLQWFFTTYRTQKPVKISEKDYKFSRVRK